MGYIIDETAERLSMTEKSTQSTETDIAPDEAASDTVKTSDAPKTDQPPKEYGGQDGPEPTRFGDWEKNGIISDF